MRYHVIHIYHVISIGLRILYIQSKVMRQSLKLLNSALVSKFVRYIFFANIT